MRIDILGSEHVLYSRIPNTFYILEHRTYLASQIKGVKTALL